MNKINFLIFFLSISVCAIAQISKNVCDNDKSISIGSFVTNSIVNSGTITHNNSPIDPKLFKAHSDSIIKAIKKIQATINNNSEDLNNIYYSEGIRYFNEKKYDKAIDYLKWFVEQYEIYPEVLSDACFYIGLAYKWKQEPECDSAIVYFQKSIDKDLKCNTCHFAHYQMGNIYEDKGKYDSAIFHYNEALKNPLSEQYSELIYTQIGNSYFWKNYSYEQRNDSALKYYNKAIEKNPYYPDVYNYIGDFYYCEQKYDSAIIYYNKVVNFFNSHAQYTYILHKNFKETTYAYPYYYSIGHAYLQKGYKEEENSNKATEYYDKVIEYCNRAIELYIDSLYYYKLVGLAYLHKQNYDKAIECFQTINMDTIINYGFTIKLDSSGVSKHLFIGNVYLQNEDYDKTIHYCEKAIKLYPSDIRAYLLIGNAYLQNEDYDKTIYYCEKAIQLDSRDALKNLLYIRDVDYDKTIYYDKSIMLGWAYLLIGNAYFCKEDYDETIYYCKKAIQLDSNNIYAYLIIGNVYFQMRNYNKAIHYNEEAIQLDSKYIYAHLLIGAIYYNKRNYDKTIYYCEEAIQLNSSDIDAHLLIGDAYFRKSYNDKASVHYQKAIENFQKETFFSTDYDAKRYWSMGRFYRKKTKYRDNTIKCFRIAAYFGNEQAQQWLKDNNIEAEK